MALEPDVQQPNRSRSKRRAMNASVVVTIVAKDVRNLRVAFPSSSLEGYRLALSKLVGKLSSSSLDRGVSLRRAHHLWLIDLAQTLVERVNQLIANTTANEAALSYGPGGRDEDWHRYDPLREMQRQVVPCLMGLSAASPDMLLSYRYLALTIQTLRKVGCATGSSQI
jgi:hypothetical protein